MGDGHLKMVRVIFDGDGIVAVGPYFSHHYYWVPPGEAQRLIQVKGFRLASHDENDDKSIIVLED